MSWLLGAKVFKWLFGDRGGLTHAGLDKLTYRNKFSDYLPYIAYDEESGIYLNTDNTIGRIWECSPVNFAGEKTIQTLEGLFKIGLPEKTLMQFILYADDYIEPIVEAHMHTLVRDNEILAKTKERFGKFLLDGKKGVANLGGTPLRNYRLFVTIKIPGGKYKESNFGDIAKNAEEILRGAFLYPQVADANVLVDMLRRFFNGHNPNFNYTNDLLIPIRKQIIFSETEIQKTMSNIKVGDSYYKCLTPKTFPTEVNPAQTNRLFGGIDGMVSDAEQYKTPYLYALNIIFHDLKSTIHGKCNLVLRQEGIGSWAPSLMRKKEEYMWAVDSLDKGVHFVRIMPILWVKGKDENEVVEAAARARVIWQGQGYTIQEDKGILPMLFISALPFGLYDTKGNIKNIERDFIAPVTSVSPILPVQGDFLGGGKPVMAFVGRKGQLSGLDIFDSHANSHNMYLAAATGVGKSFFINEFVLNYYGAGALIRMIDIGNSYKKMTNVVGAKFIDFAPDSKIVLNPFSGIIPEEFDGEMASLAAIIFRMAYSATNRVPEDQAESAMTLIKAAVRWAWRNEGSDADVGTVFTFLSTFPIHAADTDLELGCTEDDKCSENLQMISKTLAFNLSDFKPAGVWGRWFNGKGNFNIAKDEFVVLELGKLKAQEELFNVVTMQVVNAVARDLYLSDRTRNRLIVFDEAHQFAHEGTVIGKVIENGYRLARKYNGSFTIVTQSLLDLKAFGTVGNVIRGQSAFKAYLESVDFDKAKAEKVIDYDDFEMGMLRSLKSNKPKYSEIFMDTPFGRGVTRLVKDPFSYYLNTSDPKEVTEIDELVNGGMTYSDAIDEMVTKYRSN